MNNFLVIINSICGIGLLLLNFFIGYMPILPTHMKGASFAYILLPILRIWFLFFSLYQYYSISRQRYVYESITVISFWYALSCLFEAGVILLQNSRHFTALILLALIGLFLSLTYIHLNYVELEFTVPQKLFIKAPISMYFCWIVAALMFELLFYNLSVIWAVAAISALTFLSATLLILYTDYIFAATAVWILAGIALGSDMTKSIVLSCFICIAMLLFFASAKFLNTVVKRKKYHEAKIEFF